MGFGPGESCRGIYLPRLGSSLLVGSEFQYVRPGLLTEVTYIHLEPGIWLVGSILLISTD